MKRPMTAQEAQMWVEMAETEEEMWRRVEQIQAGVMPKIEEVLVLSDTCETVTKEQVTNYMKRIAGNDELDDYRLLRKGDQPLDS